MKRKILLLMMTALLSVGAWAENVWTGSTAIGFFDNNSHVQGVEIPSTISLQVGDLIVVTANVTGNYWNTVNVCKANNYWSGDVLLTLADDIASEDEKKFFIPVTTEILTALESGSPQNRLYFDGDNYTLTSVDVTHGNANIYTNAGGREQNGWQGEQLSKELFALANVGDWLAINVSAAGDYQTAKIYNLTPSSLWNGSGFDDPDGLAELAAQGFSGATKLYFQLTNDILTAAQSGGLCIGGGNYTYTSVDIYYSVTSRSVTIGTTGYATFGYPFAVDLSGLVDGQDAYTVTVSGTKAQLTSVKGKKIPAGTGIILEGSGNVTIPLTTESTYDVTGNELLVSDGTVTGDGNTIYVLANDSKGVGFYLLQNDDKLAAGKAYLVVSGGAARQFIGFGDDNETTGITMVQGEGFMVNGSDNYYDLQGRRVAQPTKGLYVVNGKKVIIK